MPERRAGLKRARVFFALWPSHETREALARLAHEVQADSGGRAVSRPNIHLTLFFVGDVAREQIAVLEAAAQAVQAGPFALTIDRIGYFRHNRIVWAGAAHCPPELIALEARLRAALEPLGLRGEDRPYVPHITLVRKAERRPVVDAVQPHAWHVRDLVLMESVAIAGGVRYEPLRQWPLIMSR